MAETPKPSIKQWNKLSSTPPVRRVEAKEPLPTGPSDPSLVPPNYNPRIAPVVNLEDMPEEKQREVLRQLEGMQQAAQDAVAPVKSDAAPSMNPASALMAEEPATTYVPDPVVFCPNCGFDVKQDPVATTDDDKRDFIRALFGSKPFEKTYILFSTPAGERFTITFRTRTTDVEDVIARQLRKEIADKRMLLIDPTLAASNFAYRMRRLQMTASLTRVSPGIEQTLPELDTVEAKELWKPSDTDEFKDDFPVAIAERKVYKKWASPLYAAAWREFQSFETLVLRLTEGANRPDFWKGTAGGH